MPRLSTRVDRNSQEFRDNAHAMQALADGLRGEEIPLWARIIGLTDAYANMVTEHSFSSARTPEQALDELVKMSGTRFDGMLVRLLLRGLKAERMPSGPGVANPGLRDSGI